MDIIKVFFTGMIENKNTGEVTLEVSTWGGVLFPKGFIYFEYEDFLGELV
jgi:hypothetical protein